MIPKPLDSCTKCGRSIRANETAEVTYREQGDAIRIEILCALHTDHEIPGTWHED